MNNNDSNKPKNLSGAAKGNPFAAAVSDTSGTPRHKSQKNRKQVDQLARYYSMAPKEPTPDTTAIWLKIARGTDKLLMHLAVFAGLGLALLMFTQVILRYLIESTFAGTEEIAILFGLWVYFLGMGHATKENEHIHGGVVTLLIKNPLTVQKIHIFGSLICIIAAGVFGFFAIKYSLFVIEKGRSSLYLGWPKGLWSASMIVGFSMMIIFFVRQLFQRLTHHSALKAEQDIHATHSSANQASN